jgi:hypothetical protein
LGTRLAIIVLALAAAAALAPASALGASIAVQGADGNIHLVSPDGSLRRQITNNAAGDNKYRAIFHADNGVLGGVRSDRFFYFFRYDGSTATGPWLAEGNSLSTSALSTAITPDGGLLAYFYIHSNTLSGGGLSPRTALMTTGGPGGSCGAPFPCHYDFSDPRWIHGTDNLGLISLGDNDVHVAAPGYPLWLTADPDDIDNFDVSRSGFRALFELSPAGTPSGGATEPKTLVLWNNNGPPPDASQGQQVCQVENITTADLHPRFSPDGSQIAYVGNEGVYVSPTPTSGPACNLQPKLVFPGGSQPEWGAGNVPTGPAGPSQGGRPAVTFTLAGRLPRLLRALNRGLPFFVRTNTAGRATVQVLGSGRFAARTTVVARGSRRLPRAGRYKVVAKFTRKAKRRFRRMRKVRLTAKVTVRATGDGATTKRKRLTLRR